jgi:hypothetical protein
MFPRGNLYSKKGYRVEKFFSTLSQPPPIKPTTALDGPKELVERWWREKAKGGVIAK